MPLLCKIGLHTWKDVWRNWWRNPWGEQRFAGRQCTRCKKKEYTALRNITPND